MDISDKHRLALNALRAWTLDDRFPTARELAAALTWNTDDAEEAAKALVAAGLVGEILPAGRDSRQPDLRYVWLAGAG